jgi:hypothetical protein
MLLFGSNWDALINALPGWIQVCREQLSMMCATTPPAYSIVNHVHLVADLIKIGTHFSLDPMRVHTKTLYLHGASVARAAKFPGGQLHLLPATSFSGFRKQEIGLPSYSKVS